MQRIKHQQEFKTHVQTEANKTQLLRALLSSQEECVYKIYFSGKIINPIISMTGEPPIQQSVSFNYTCTTVVMNMHNKIKGQINLDKEKQYQALAPAMVVDTHSKVEQLMDKLYHGNAIDEKTINGFVKTPILPRIPEFYTLTNILKPTPVDGPIICGCDGPT